MGRAEAVVVVKRSDDKQEKWSIPPLDPIESDAAAVPLVAPSPAKSPVVTAATLAIAAAIAAAATEVETAAASPVPTGGASPADGATPKTLVAKRSAASSTGAEFAFEHSTGVSIADAADYLEAAGAVAPPGYGGVVWKDRGATTSGDKSAAARGKMKPPAGRPTKANGAAPAASRGSPRSAAGSPRSGAGSPWSAGGSPRSAAGYHAATKSSAARSPEVGGSGRGGGGRGDRGGRGGRGGASVTPQRLLHQRKQQMREKLMKDRVCHGAGRAGQAGEIESRGKTTPPPKQRGGHSSSSPVSGAGSASASASALALASTSGSAGFDTMCRDIVTPSDLVTSIHVRERDRIREVC